MCCRLKNFAKLYRDSNIKMNTSIILHKQAQKHTSLALLYWHQRIKTDVAEKGGIGDKCHIFVAFACAMSRVLNWINTDIISASTRRTGPGPSKLDTTTLG